ncbi:hypothetical protein ACHAWF_002119 [Thalassiosira exigua]
MAPDRSQAYQLKSIRYKNVPTKILLQNENGPCPLLAAANALLLRGAITLDPVCVRNGVASTDDVINMLANRALATGSGGEADKMVTSNSSHHEYHLNEVLSLLPDLQHGMDVNPKFTSGPTSVEYTKNLAAFDLLGVELVHGWLSDPQDMEAESVIGNRTYNELIETVIHGNELLPVVQKLEAQIVEKQSILDEGLGVAAEPRPESEQSDAIGGAESIAQSNTNQQQQCNSGGSTDDGSSSTGPDGANEAGVAESMKPNDALVHDEVALQKEIFDMREKMSDLSLQISQSEVANAFLTSSGHQLTYYGLEQLHTHIGEDALCVFFRNNHFATLTKHGGVLYLLVTDLGYANTPEIVWEKLDNIDGNTEHANEFFAKPTPRAELKPAAGPTIAPELLLAQRSQAESDFQLALAMSKGTANPQRLDDDEGRLIEAAKELSLKTFNGDDKAQVSVGAENSSQIDSDREVALSYQRAQMQSEHDSEQLARQLQELEYARQRNQRPVPNPRRPASAGNDARPASAKSGCTIS